MANHPADIVIQAHSCHEGHGHCPLFTHSGAGEALSVGVASAMAVAALAGDAVAVAPNDIAVGFNDMAGTTGDVYWPMVDESPDPPAI